MPRQRTDLSKTVQRNEWCACGDRASFNTFYGKGPWVCLACYRKAQAARAEKGSK